MKWIEKLPKHAVEPAMMLDLSPAGWFESAAATLQR